MIISCLNVKTFPLACDEALSLILNEIEVLRLDKTVKVLKVVHGYGSNGVGGKIKAELNTLLKVLTKQGKILDFVQNEKFTPNSTKYKHFTKLYPQLILDADLQNQNAGITIIFLN